MNSFTSAEIKNRLKRLIGGFRWRTVVMVAVIYLFSFSIVASSVIYLARTRGEGQLSYALVQGVKAFGYTSTRDFDTSVTQAEFLAADPCLNNYRNSSHLKQSFASLSPVDKKTLTTEMLTSLANISKDAVAIVDSEGNICLFVERVAPKEKSSGTPSETDFSKAETPNKNGEDNGQDEVAKNIDKLEADFLDSVFKFGEASKGCLRFSSSPSAPLYGVVAVALNKGNKNADKREGALLLAERIDDKALVKWSQSMPPGLLVLVAQGKVVSAYDKRSDSRPTPTMAAELDKMLKYWNPRQNLAESGKGSSQFKITSSDVKLAGQTWKAAVAELDSSKKRDAVAYLVFLADPMNLEQEIRQHIWVLGICLVVTLFIQSILVYFLSPVCLHFARAHLQAGSVHLVSLEASASSRPIPVLPQVAASEAPAAAPSAAGPIAATNPTLASESKTASPMPPPVAKSEN